MTCTNMISRINSLVQVIWHFLTSWISLAHQRLIYHALMDNDAILELQVGCGVQKDEALTRNVSGPLCRHAFKRSHFHFKIRADSVCGHTDCIFKVYRESGLRRSITGWSSEEGHEKG